MKLFTVGPVEMFKEQMEIGGKQVPYFRNQAFSDVVLRCMELLKKAVDAPSGSEAIFLTCSGTGAMESTIINCFNENDHLIVIDGGSFGHRFLEICQLHKIPHTVVNVPDDQDLTREMIDKACEGVTPTGLIVNIHETSKGKLYDKKMLSDYCKEKGIYFVVDDISSFLADPISMKEDGIDLIILSSQKGLALAPGLAMIIVGPKLLAKSLAMETKSFYLDFKSHLKNGERGQTPFTPSVRVIHELKNRLEMLDIMGVNNVIRNTEEIAKDFRKKVKELGLDYPKFALSNAETPVIFPEGTADAYEVFKKLDSEYGFVVNPSGGELASKQFRVGHIGNHSIEDNDLLINAMKEIMGK